MGLLPARHLAADLGPSLEVEESPSMDALLEAP
jgi:hypothetical protein